MDQNLGQGGEVQEMSTPIHPDQALIDTVTGRGVLNEGEELPLAEAVATRAVDNSTQVYEETINGYTPDHLRAIRKMLEKDPWRS